MEDEKPSPEPESLKPEEPETITLEELLKFPPGSIISIKERPPMPTHNKNDTESD
jgi:hypothetical protein